MKEAQDSNEEEKRLLRRIGKARFDRDKFSKVYNDYYDLSYPAKLRVNDDTNDVRPPGDQDDIFDPSLQELTEDFVADMADEFTPSYRYWTDHEPIDILKNESERKQVKEYIDDRMSQLYDAIRRSSFEEASPECYHDMGIGPFAMNIRYSQSDEVDCEYVPLAQLLILPGPKGGVGLRAWERPVEERDLYTVFPRIDWEAALRKSKGEILKGHQTHKVIECWERDYSKSRETWKYCVLAQGKVHFQRVFTGRGSCGLIVGRVRVSVPSAYGLGPANKAIAPARTLNRLAYLELKRMGKVVDPPGIFSDPLGILNPEQGFEPGYWYEAGEGFSIEELGPQTDMREAFFKRDELEMQIRRALFQDKPFQRGLTPPSAAQWLGQEAQQEKRKTLPRARVHQEWVLGVIHRFEWILEKRGELLPLIIDDRVIRVEPRSPLSRASDIQEAQVADQLLTMFTTKFPQLAQQRVNFGKTFTAVQQKMGDRLVHVLTDEEAQQQAMEMMAQQAMAQGAPAR